MTDHQGNGLGGRYVIIEYTLPSLEDRWPNGIYSVQKTTGHGGKFTFPLTAELTDPLGAVIVTLIYNPLEDAKFYKNASIEKQIYIKSPTEIILEDFPNKMIRNQGYLIKGYILDDQNKGVVSERLNVYLGGDENFWQIYSVTTDTDGNFTLSILVPTSFPLGVHPVELNLGLNDRYEGLTISDITEIFSEPLIMLKSNGTITKGKDFIISLTLTEDNGKVPISKSIVKLYVEEIPITQVITDEDGYANYKFKFPPDEDSIHVRATFNGSANEYYVAAQGEATFKPDEPTKEPDYYSGFNQLWYLIIIIVAIVCLFVFWRWWSRHRFSLARRMVTDIISRLETSDRSRRVIYEAYIKLMGVLRRFRIIRQEAETPREFVDTVETSLPGINSRHLDSLTSLFEEARYSNHRLDKSKRSRAVRNLKHIRHSLETKNV
jgi:hypothetical protein